MHEGVCSILCVKMNPCLILSQLASQQEAWQNRQNLVKGGAWLFTLHSLRRTKNITLHPVWSLSMPQPIANALSPIGLGAAPSGTLARAHLVIFSWKRGRLTQSVAIFKVCDIDLSRKTSI